MQPKTDSPLSGMEQFHRLLQERTNTGFFVESRESRPRSADDRPDCGTASYLTLLTNTVFLP